MEALALVHHVEDPIRVPGLHPLTDRGQVGGGVERRAVGLHDDAGRHLLGVRGLLHLDDLRALALHEQAALPHFLQHGGNVGLGVALAEPDLKADAELVVVLPQVGLGDGHDMLPDRHVAGSSLLKLVGGVVRPARKGLVLLGTCGGSRINLFQIRDREGSLRGVGAGVSLVKVAELRLPILQRGNHQTHLQAPVAEVGIADGLVAEEVLNALDALADDGRAQMADVQRLGHVGSAVVYDHGAGLRITRNAEARHGTGLLQILCQESGGQPQIQEARRDGLNLGKCRVVRQMHSHVVCDLNGRLVVGLCRGHRAVALVLAEVGPVGDRHPPVGSFIPGRHESGGYVFGNDR